MTPTPRTDEVRGHIAERYNGHGSMSIAYTEMGKWADKLERELEETKAQLDEQKRHAANLFDIGIGLKKKMFECNDQLTAHKDAVKECKVALERAQTGIGAPGPASTAWAIKVAIQNALTAINELNQEAKP